MQVVLRALTWRRSSLVLMDHLLIVGGVMMAALLRVGPESALHGWQLIWRASLVGVVVQICLHYSDLYDTRLVRDRRDLIVGLLQALGAGMLIVALVYYWLPQLVLGRGVFLIGAVLVGLFIMAWRVAFEWISTSFGPQERLLIVGTGSAALDLARELDERRHGLGVEVTGFIASDERREA